MNYVYAIKTLTCIHYFNAKHLYHREDGPAVECANGDKEWHYNGEHIKVKSQKEFEKFLKTLAFR